MIRERRPPPIDDLHPGVPGSQQLSQDLGVTVQVGSRPNETGAEHHELRPSRLPDAVDRRVVEIPRKDRRLDDAEAEQEDGEEPELREKDSPSQGVREGSDHPSLRSAA
jgi:hypothetical protein